MIKKIFLILILFCLSLSPIFGQDIVYNGIVELSTKTLVIVNDGVYSLGDEIANSNCTIEEISIYWILLKCDDEQVTVEWIGYNK